MVQSIQEDSMRKIIVLVLLLAVVFSAYSQNSNCVYLMLTPTSIFKSEYKLVNDKDEVALSFIKLCGLDEKKIAMNELLNKAYQEGYRLTLINSYSSTVGEYVFIKKE